MSIVQFRSLFRVTPAARRRASGRRVIALGLFVAGCLTRAAAVEAGGTGEPNVPPGRDPGGVPVAMIGPGIDYRMPEVHQRIARDGEGDLIGWDFADNDLKPYSPDGACPVQPCVATDVRSRASPAQILLEEAETSKLIVLRTKDGDRGTLAAAIAFAARSPARIVPTLARRSDPAGAAIGPDWPLMFEAARRFSNLLFIVPAYGPPIDVPGFDKLPIGNLLIVSPVTPEGTASQGEDQGEETSPRPEADIAVSIPEPVQPTAPRTMQVRAEQAVARIAALAARLSAVDPILDAHSMKEKILSLAQHLPAASTNLARSGWLPDPRR